VPKQKSNSLLALTILSTLSGIIYNSWIVGYWLNPLVARNDLASELEALHQPYNWFFVLCDIICSSMAIGVAYVLWRPLRRVKRTRLLMAALLNVVLFAAGTIFDALVPLHCDPSAQVCPALIHDPLVIVHGLFSILASACLFITMALLWWLNRRSHLMNLIVVGYILFGVFSVISLITPNQDSWAQHYSLIFDGVCLAIIPYVVIKLTNFQKN
jgi:hypothetical protein